MMDMSSIIPDSYVSTHLWQNYKQVSPNYTKATVIRWNEKTGRGVAMGSWH